jgi:hypothetical protein
MTSRIELIAAVLRRPGPVREPLAVELRGTVVQMVGPSTSHATWTATPEVLAAAIDSALQKDTPTGASAKPRGAEFTARAKILAVLEDAGYNTAAAAGLLARAHCEPHEAEPDPDCLESLAGGHALVIEHGDYELIGTCQCGRRLGSLIPSGSVDQLAALWERHTCTELPAAPSAIGAS